MRESVDETKDDFEIDEVVVTIEESIGKTRNEDNCESYFKEITEQKNETRFFCVFNVLRIVFVNVLYLLLPNFTLLNRFVNVANRRDKYGLTPLHAIARMKTITINTLCDTFVILIKSGGNIYLQDRRGCMPYQLSRYSFHRSGRFAVLRPKKTYLRFQGFMLTVLFVLFFSTAIVMIKWNNVYFNRNISRPNNQHKCEVAKGRKYNDTLNVYNEFTISQQSLSKPFEVILPILLFSIPYFVLSRRLYIVPLIGKKFTMYFVGVQVLKLVCFTILILSNVYCSSNLTGWFLNFPFWQFSLIYFFHTDFRLLWYLQITADGIKGVLRKQFAILATTLYYLVWLIVFMTQIYKIELSSSRWEILVNCSRPVHENSSMYKCQYGSNDVVIHLLSEQNNTYTVSQYNTCSGTKTANEMMVDDILFNIYSSLLGFVCLLCIFYQTEIGYCLSCLSHPNIWIKCISSIYIYRCIFWKIGASWPFAAKLMWVSMIGIVRNIRFFFLLFHVSILSVCIPFYSIRIYIISEACI